MPPGILGQSIDRARGSREYGLVVEVMAQVGVQLATVPYRRACPFPPPSSLSSPDRREAAHQLSRRDATRLGGDDARILRRVDLRARSRGPPHASSQRFVQRRFSEFGQRQAVGVLPVGGTSRMTPREDTSVRRVDVLHIRIGLLWTHVSGRSYELACCVNIVLLRFLDSSPSPVRSQ